MTVERNFENISEIIIRYQNGIAETLQAYEKEYHRNEDLYTQTALATQRETARLVAADKIKQLKGSFTTTLNGAVDSLQTALLESMTTAPNPSFLTKLDVYGHYNIQPTKIEIEALLKSNEGRMLGLRALNGVLAGLDSHFRVRSASLEDVETDLESLRRLAEHPDWFPLEGDNLSHLKTILGETDSTKLLIQATAFEASANAIQGMKERWESALMPSPEIYEAAATEEERTRIAEQALQVTESATIETEGEDIKFAKRLAEHDNQNNFRLGMSNYTKG